MKNTTLQPTILLILLVGMLFSCNQHASYSGVDEMVNKAMNAAEGMTANQLKQLVDDGEMILLLDVREPNEFNAGYIPGALNIPRGTLEFKIANEDFWDEAMLYMPEKNEPIIVYCKKGKRSILAAQSLGQLGYTNVKFVEGGWKRWELSYPLIFEKNLDVLPHDDGGEVGGC